MPAPTISTIVVVNDDNGGIECAVAVSEDVTMTDLTGVSINIGTINSFSLDTLKINFVITGQKAGDVLTMSFLASNTIESVSDSTALAETLDVVVTNSIVAPASSVTQNAGELQDSAAIHTAVKVLADEAEATCKAAC